MTDIDPNKFLGPVTFNNIILWLLAFATVVFIVDAIGLMPPSIARWLARNKLDTTLQAFKKLGVKVTWNEKKSNITVLQTLLDSSGIKELEYKASTRSMLAEDTFQSSVKIGDTRSFSSETFIDVMGSSTSSSRALAYAKLLNTHLSLVEIGSYDIVATPKTGSPILGYEFSKLVDKPLILGVLEKDKVTEKKGEMGLHISIDFPKDLTLRDKTILIVDDSTTGGRKMVNLIDKLRAEGAIVTDALVLFEPKGKGARESLRKHDVALHSIIDGPIGKY